MKVRIDIAKIFLTPPSTMYERIVLFLMLTVTFIMFFGPLKFSSMSPFEAVITAAMPALSISWGWIVLIRSIFRKKDFCKKV
jgi:hypothetical protein